MSTKTAESLRRAASSLRREGEHFDILSMRMAAEAEECRQRAVELEAEAVEREAQPELFA